MYIHMQAIYVGVISAFMKVVCFTLAEELELSLGRAESSEHGSTNFCAFCLSTTTTGYSKSCLLVLTSMKALPKSQHGYVVI